MIGSTDGLNKKYSTFIVNKVITFKRLPKCSKVQFTILNLYMEIKTNCQDLRVYILNTKITIIVRKYKKVVYLLNYLTFITKPFHNLFKFSQNMYARLIIVPTCFINCTIIY